MELKKPAECCGTPTLLWSPQKGYYICPCGKMRVNNAGQLIKRSFNRFFPQKGKRRAV